MQRFVLAAALIFAMSSVATGEARFDRARGHDAASDGDDRDRAYDEGSYERGDRFHSVFSAPKWRERDRCNWCTLADWHRFALRPGYERFSGYEGAADWHHTYPNPVPAKPAAATQSATRHR